MEWSDYPPANDGDFFYAGPVPNGEDVTAIVQIFTAPEGHRMACLFIPPGWRGDKSRAAVLHYGKIGQWRGKWSGPEFGLCCVEG